MKSRQHNSIIQNAHTVKRKRNIESRQRNSRMGNAGALSIQPKIPVISVGTSNGTDHFGLVRPEYSGPALKVVLFDRSGHFGRSDRNVPFHLTKLLSPVPLFCILLARTITKRVVAWVGSVEPECTVPLNTENFRNFKPEFLLNGKRPRIQIPVPKMKQGTWNRGNIIPKCGMPNVVNKTRIMTSRQHKSRHHNSNKYAKYYKYKTDGIKADKE